MLPKVVKVDEAEVANRKDVVEKEFDHKYCGISHSEPIILICLLEHWPAIELDCPQSNRPYQKSPKECHQVPLYLIKLPAELAFKLQPSNSEKFDKLYEQ